MLDYVNRPSIETTIILHYNNYTNNNNYNTHNNYRLAATLLRFLCIEEKARVMIKSYDGIPLLLRYNANYSVPIYLCVYII